MTLEQRLCAEAEPLEAKGLIIAVQLYRSAFKVDPSLQVGDYNYSEYPCGQ